MVHQRGHGEKERREVQRKLSLFSLPECEQYVWIRIELHVSEIAPFYSTSVYFESVSLAFLHLTWWLHHFPQGTEYISESGHSTGFLSARKQQLVREGLHLTTDLWSYLAWVCLPDKTFRPCTVKHNHHKSCNYNAEANYSSDDSSWEVFAVSLEKFVHRRFTVY